MIAMTQRAVLHTLAVAALVACGAAHADGKYVLISHAPDSDSWWNTIKNAVKQAGEDYGVTVDYHDDLNKTGFSISNPNAKGTCGCGSSFAM